MQRLSRRSGMLLAIAAATTVAGAVFAWRLLPTGALAFAGGHPVPLAAYRGPDPTGVPPELTKADLVSRGRYLAKVADCEVCHTTPGGAPYGGGVAFRTALGTIYSPNITADAMTGIGSWSDKDFLRALHDGVRPNGERLYPAFPYDAYAQLTDADAVAIKAYIFTLPAVRRRQRPNSLAFPFNQRSLMALWALAYAPHERFHPRAERSPAWNRGAYVAEALAHCGDCHTPRNLAQGLDNRRKFAGADVQGWRAFNITSDHASGVGDWSNEDLRRYLVGGHVAGRGAAAGPMAEAIEGGLSVLTPSDLRALTAYLRSVPARADAALPAPRRTPAPEVPDPTGDVDRGDGRRIYEEACAACHGWSGASPLSTEADLTGLRAVNDRRGLNVAAAVVHGVPRRGASALAMPSFGAAYSDTEIAAVSNYVTGRFGALRSRLTGANVARLRP